MRRAARVALTPRERARLRRWSDPRTRGERWARRARILLEAARGRPNSTIARSLKVDPETVGRWRIRFATQGFDALRLEAPRSGHSDRIPLDLVERVLTTTHSTAAPGARAWTTRSLARRLETNHMVVHRIWQKYGLSGSRTLPPSPSHRVDLAAVHLGDPANVLVFSIRPRTPSLPGGPPEPAAGPRAPELAIPNPAAQLRRAASHQGAPSRPGGGDRGTAPFLVFLREAERAAPEGSRLEAIFDRPTASLGRRLLDWLDAHPRFRAFTSTRPSEWEGAVEGWFRRWDRASLGEGYAAAIEPVLTMASRGSRAHPPLPGVSWIARPADAHPTHDP